MRYIVIENSESEHCCFKYSVIDTSNVDYIDMIVCETFTQVDANKICSLLNIDAE